MTLKHELTELFKTSLNKLDLLQYIATNIVVQETANTSHGDYQFNIAMSLAKKNGRNPHDLAKNIIDNLPDNNLISRCEIAGPGFINITLTDKFLLEFVQNKLLTSCYVNNPQLVIVDYSSPNLAKQMHVGHLRSTIIGDSLVRINEFIGNKVIRRNHVGDWGTQFGMLLAYILENNLYQNNKLDIQNLEELYQKAKIKFEESEEFANKSREYVVKLQSGDELMYSIWQEFVKISTNHCQQLYDLLQVKLQPDDIYGESYYNHLLPRIIDILQQQSMLEISQGAACVFYKDEVFIVRKKDGGFLYSTTDLATIYDRVNQLHVDKILYVVDARQSQHFQLLFAISKQAKIAPDNLHLEHVKFGVMCDSQGKPFKTREGGTVKLLDLLKEAKIRAEKMLIEKGVELNRMELAKSLSISAIKYADLSKNRTSDYMFNYDHMLSFEGNTAPYILYAYTRINSIFNKAMLYFKGSKVEDLSALLETSIMLIEHKIERELILHIVIFPDTILKTAGQSMPHFLCNYVYKLATLFMRFYETCPVIIVEKTEGQNHLNKLSKSRLKLLVILSTVIQYSLDCLGISTVTRM